MKLEISMAILSITCRVHLLEDSQAKQRDGETKT